MFNFNSNVSCIWQSFWFEKYLYWDDVISQYIIDFWKFFGSENNVADENSNETDQTDSKEDGTNNDDDSKEAVTENTDEDNNSEEDKDGGMLPFNA